MSTALGPEELLEARVIMNPLTTPGDMARTLDRLAATGATLARG